MKQKSFVRSLSTKVKKASGRKSSSTRWLQRQLNDPYVREAELRGYRSRAAFKLIEMDDRFKFLKKGSKIIDLGAAPGGWTQVSLERVGPKGKVISVDIQEKWEGVPGAECVKMDFTSDLALDKLLRITNGSVDIVLSDMAAASTGHAKTDHLRIMSLAELAWDFASQILLSNGVFVCKLLQGGAELSLLNSIKKNFLNVKHVKPPASRKDSSEMYLFAQGFKRL
jgi:23S rRNA (uridine2552-2'-O)-methyltransferase